MTFQTELKAPPKSAKRKASSAIAPTKANAPPKAGPDCAANEGEPTEGVSPATCLAADAIGKAFFVGPSLHTSQAEPNHPADAKPSEDCFAGSAPTASPATDLAQDDAARPLKPGRFAQLLTLRLEGRAIPLAEITTTFGWQPHSARAALGGLRKAGHTIEARNLATGGSAYVLSGAAIPAAEAKP